MNDRRADDGADLAPDGATVQPSPMAAIAFQRRMIGCLLAALALIVATFFISGWRPLFGGAGYGLVIELVSLGAGIALAIAATIANVGRLLGHHLGARNKVAAPVIGAVVAVAVGLDLLAVTVVIFRA